MNRPVLTDALVPRYFQMYYDWFVANNMTRIHVMIDVMNHDDVVLRGNAPNGAADIVINVAPHSIVHLEATPTHLKFQVTFAKIPHFAEVPWKHVRYLFSPEIPDVVVNIGGAVQIDMMHMAAEEPVKETPVPEGKVVSLASRKEKK